MPFLPKVEEGVFLGYHITSMNKWSGDYIVARLADFKNKYLEREMDPRTARIPTSRSAKVITEKTWEFPLKEYFDRVNKTLSEKKSAVQPPAAAESPAGVSIAQQDQQPRAPPAEGEAASSAAGATPADVVAEPQPPAPPPAYAPPPALPTDILGSIDIKKPFPWKSTAPFAKKMICRK